MRKTMFGLKHAEVDGNGRFNFVACRFCIRFGRNPHGRTAKTSLRIKQNKVFDSLRT